MSPLYSQFQTLFERVIEKSDSSAEKDALKLQMKSIQDSWERLRDLSSERNRQINHIKLPSQKYHFEDLEFVDWLTTTEKKLGQLDAVPVSVNEAERLVSDLKVRDFYREFFLILSVQDNVLLLSTGTCKRFSIRLCKAWYYMMVNDR